MIKSRIFALALLLASCLPDNRKFTKSEFLILNNSGGEILVRSSAIVHYQSGPEEENLDHRIGPRELRSLRIIDVSNSFDIDDVFTRLEISRHGDVSAVSIMDKTLWEKAVNARGLVTYTLNVDSAHFTID